MYCSQCATQLSETDVYCPNCQKPVASFNLPIALNRSSGSTRNDDCSPDQAGTVPQTAPRHGWCRSSRRLCMLAAGILVTLIGLGMYLAGKHSAAGGNPGSPEIVATPTATVTPVPVTPHRHPFQLQNPNVKCWMKRSTSRGKRRASFVIV